MPPRFCSQCGTKVAPGAKFCSECGSSLSGGPVPRPATVASPWQLTTGGIAVFGLLLLSGLGVWTAILTPEPPRPAPGRGPAAGASAAAGDAEGQPPQPVPLPAEVKTFISDLAKKADANPEDLDVWRRLGKVYSRAAQLDPSYDPQALAAFDHVLARDPNDLEALHGKADVFYDRGDHKQAIPIFERYLTLAGDDPSARTDLATMYLSAGDSPKAIAMYKDVIAKHPDFLQAHYNLAVSYAQLGDSDEALASFKKARALAPDDKVRGQIDQMVSRLTGEAAPAAEGGAAPAGAASTSRSAFQQDVEKRLRAAPIMGDRIVRIDWSGPASARVGVRNFPMSAMPDEVRGKFTDRLKQELAAAAKANAPGGEVRLEIADADGGTVMATVAPGDTGGSAEQAPPAAARSAFQEDVEKRLRAAPIMGDRIVRVDWNGPGSARVVVQNFPMDGMPEEVRGKFTDRLTQELRAAAQANHPAGDVKLEIADAGAGTVMATVTP
jgi:tetratricopeptide (TPR) repeat protein